MISVILARTRFLFMRDWNIFGVNSMKWTLYIGLVPGQHSDKDGKMPGLNCGQNLECCENCWK